MAELRAAGEQDNVKRRQAWLDGHPGATVEADPADWWTARDRAGVMLRRRQELGDLMDELDKLEGR